MIYCPESSKKIIALNWSVYIWLKIFQYLNFVIIDYECVSSSIFLAQIYEVLKALSVAEKAI